MTLQEAYAAVRAHQDNTDKGAAEAVDFMWNRLSIEDEDMDKLARIGFLLGLGTVNRNPILAEDEPRVRASVRTTEYAVGTTTRVRVSVLYETRLATETGSKILAHFAVPDCQWYINNSMDKENGLRRHREVMEHIQARLRTCGKKTLADLGDGEQQIIERAWEAARDGREPSAEFSRFKKKATAA